MTIQEARQTFNRIAKEAAEKGNHDAAATIELAREFFTNPDFRKALEQHVWDVNQGEGR